MAVALRRGQARRAAGIPPFGAAAANEVMLAKVQMPPTVLLVRLVFLHLYLNTPCAPLILIYNLLRGCHRIQGCDSPVRINGSNRAVFTIPGCA